MLYNLWGMFQILKWSRTTTYTGLWYEVLAKSYVGILTGNAQLGAKSWSWLLRKKLGARCLFDCANLIKSSPFKASLLVQKTRSCKIFQRKLQTSWNFQNSWRLPFQSCPTCQTAKVQYGSRLRLSWFFFSKNLGWWNRTKTVSCFWMSSLRMREPMRVSGDPRWMWQKSEGGTNGWHISWKLALLLVMFWNPCRLCSTQC